MRPDPLDLRAGDSTPAGGNVPRGAAAPPGPGPVQAGARSTPPMPARAATSGADTPVAWAVQPQDPAARGRQRLRRTLQAGFFALFLLAPALDLLRFDLTETQLWFLGQRWSLGIDAFRAGEISATQAAWAILWRGFLPGLAFVALFLGVAWRHGRLYCGWLCPHFSAVEVLNDLLHRAIGKFSVWERHATPRAGRAPQRRWWPVFALACTLLGFTWSITALTYLLPPATVWGHLVGGTLTPNQARFIVIGGVLFSLEFAFARHLFCRFGCAAGLFQSLAWMANPRGRVVAFARERARDCRDCHTADAPEGSACDQACPMRLHPRNIKRMMFSCVQCARCLTACDDSRGQAPGGTLLHWAVGVDAVRETLRQRRREREADATQEGAAPGPIERQGHAPPGARDDFDDTHPQIRADQIRPVAGPTLGTAHHPRHHPTHPPTHHPAQDPPHDATRGRPKPPCPMGPCGAMAAVSR